MGIIVSAFPGTGKSYFTRSSSKYKCSDSDSSSFSWLEAGVRNPDFPNNYINHILKIKDDYDVVFVSTHEDVLNKLIESKVKFICVVPSNLLKAEYSFRYYYRGNNDQFIKVVQENWMKWLENIRKKSSEYSQIMTRHVLIHEDKYIDEALIDSFYMKSLS